jgi:hypothetical protein
LKGKLIFIIFLLISCSAIQAQQITISGRITDAETGEGLPYVLISIYRTSYGGESDENGNYSFQANVKNGDSIVVTYLGYKKIRKAVKLGIPDQVINFALQPDGNMMEEVLVTVYENPAFPIMRRVIRNKDTNDPRKIKAYRYDNYSKMEVSIDNLGHKMQKKKFMRAVEKELAKDSLTLEKGNDGKPVMPVIFSETISKVYRNREGLKSKEEIIAVKTNNVGLANGKIIKPMLYSTYQENNFYLNRITILQTDFQSPIADGWQLLYEYELVDTVFIDGDSCYQINVKPKNPQDLAFTGTIWIADSTYALKQLQLTTNQKTKLNYVESIKIFQLNQITSDKSWMPIKTRIELDLSNITHWRLGILARLTTYASNIVVNDPMPDKFFKEGLVEKEDARDRGREMDTLRRDTLSTYEKNFKNSISTIREVKPIKRYVALANLASTGYWKFGKIELGHILSLYNNNNIEGVRTGLAIRTSERFSRKFILKGYGAYGFHDERFKYSLSVDYIVDRSPWTMIGFEHRYDMDQVGVNAEQLGNNQIFYAFTRNGTMRGPYYNTSDFIYFQTDLRRSITQRVAFRYKDFIPAYPFAYYSTSEETVSGSPKSSVFSTSEIILDTRWAKDEFKFIDGNKRLSLGAKKWPIVNFRNVIGLKDVFNSEFSYYKASILVSHNFPMGILGRTYYDFSIGKIFGTVPYPILETHIGNQSNFYSTVAFNQMNYFEFISDTYATLRYRHYFGGLFFNRIPVIKKFKWGFFVTSNLAFGSMSAKNYNLVPSTDLAGENLRPFYTLNTKPYWEVGYGIDNIFKVLRVDFVHRLTYLHVPDVRRFGIKLSFQLSL